MANNNTPPARPPSPLAAAPPSFWGANPPLPPQGAYAQGGGVPRPRSASPSGPRLPTTPQPTPGGQYVSSDALTRARSQALSNATSRRLDLERQIRWNNSLLNTTSNPVHQAQIQARSTQLSLEWERVLEEERAAIAAVTSSLPFRPVATPQFETQALPGDAPANFIFPTPDTLTRGNFDTGSKIIITSEKGIPSAVIVKDLGAVTAAASSRGLTMVTTEQKQRVKERLRDAALLVNAHAVVNVVLRRDPKDGHLYGSGRAVKLVYTKPRPPDLIRA